MAWFTRDVTRTLLAQAPVLALGLAASVLTARVMGPTDRGIYALCFMVANTAVFFGSLELGQSVVYHIGRRGLEPARALGAALGLLALLALAAFAALRVAEPLLLRFFDAFTPEILRLVALMAPLMLGNAIVIQFFRALDRIDFFNVCRILAPAIRLVALSIAFALGGGMLEALQAVAVAEAALLPLQLFLLLRLVRPRLGGRAAARSLVRFGAQLEGSSAIEQVDYRVAGFAVALFCAAADVGYYAIADGMVTYLLTLPILVGNVLAPKIARMPDAEAAGMAAATCRSTLFVTAGLGVSLALLSHPLVSLLYGAEFLPSALLVVALAPVAVARSGVRILGHYVVVSNRVRLLAIVNAVTLLVHASLIFSLVPGLGAIGAAFAVSTGYVLQLALVALVFRRLSGLPLRDVLLVQGQDLQRMLRAVGDGLELSRISRRG